MATTQPGGLYKVGDQFVDANGNPTKATKATKAEAGAAEFDIETATKASLVEEAERRNLTDIKRTDGGDGDLRAEDYRAALT